MSRQADGGLRRICSLRRGATQDRAAERRCQRPQRRAGVSRCAWVACPCSVCAAVRRARRLRHLAKHPRFHVVQQWQWNAQRPGASAVTRNERFVPGGMLIVCLRTWNSPASSSKSLQMPVQVDRVLHHRVVDEHEAHALAVAATRAARSPRTGCRRTTKRSAPCGPSGAARSFAAGTRPSGSANAERRSA